MLNNKKILKFQNAELSSRKTKRAGVFRHVCFYVAALCFFLHILYHNNTTTTIKEKKSWKKGKTKYTNDIDYCLSIKIKCVSGDKKINLFHHVQCYVYFKGIKNF